MKLSYISLLVIIVSFLEICMDLSVADPTDGFTPQPFSFNVQKPYDKPLDQRYNNIGGVQSFWVYEDDKPFKSDSDTKPRTEARVQGQDYTSGIRQFEGYVYIPSGTSGACIMQIFGGGNGATTTLQLRIYNGEIKYYNVNVVEGNAYDRWLRVNVIHNVNVGQIEIFINGVRKLQVGDRGAGTMYFKFGVYAQDGSTHRMESRWRNVQINTK